MSTKSGQDQKAMYLDYRAEEGHYEAAHSLLFKIEKNAMLRVGFKKIDPKREFLASLYVSYATPILNPNFLIDEIIAASADEELRKPIHIYMLYLYCCAIKAPLSKARVITKLYFETISKIYAMDTSLLDKFETRLGEITIFAERKDKAKQYLEFMLLAPRARWILSGSADDKAKLEKFDVIFKLSGVIKTCVKEFYKPKEHLENYILSTMRTVNKRLSDQRDESIEPATKKQRVEEANSANPSAWAQGAPTHFAAPTVPTQPPVVLFQDPFSEMEDDADVMDWYNSL